MRRREEKAFALLPTSSSSRTLLRDDDEEKKKKTTTTTTTLKKRKRRRSALKGACASVSSSTGGIIAAFFCVACFCIFFFVVNATFRMNHRRESESDDIERREGRNARKRKDGETKNAASIARNQLPSFADVFGDDVDADVSLKSFSRVEKKVLEYERKRIYASEVKTMRQDEMKTRNENTGKWRMLSKPRRLNSTEMRGYVDHIESEEARAKGALKTLQALKCETEKECEKVVEELVSKIIDEFKKSEKLFVDHEVVSSINLSNRAFGSRNAERAILTLSGDKEQLKMLGLDEEKMNGFRELGRKRGGKKACAVVGNGPVEENRNSERWEEEDEDAGDGEKRGKNNIGRTIDSHDVVFRVNQGPTSGRYEEKVGSKTEFRVLNNAWSEKYGQESAIGKKLREAVEMDETVISTRANAERFYELANQFYRSSLHPPWMASDRLQSDVRKLLEKVRLVKTRVTVMREENIERDGLKEHEDKKHAIIKGGTTPSTGILAIFLAIASGCDTVEPYGFSFGHGRFSGNNGMKTYHYFVDKESFHNPTHSYALEGEILRVVKRLGF